MVTLMLPLVLASCASPSPSGHTCVDTVVLSSPIPSWLPLAILAVIIVIAVVVSLIMTRRRRT
ncbi:hypothetical protein AB4Z18_07270 [Leifsonia sp. 2TAF2]|uniref:hypothetical protein n=1 Tax=Leifsonia sp. 2TAF2 TaxID=3233009 RepID=UPI003F98B446